MSDKTSGDKTAYYQKNSEKILNRAIKNIIMIVKKD